jgi:ribA/ribD-fused uncharacterized protein
MEVNDWCRLALLGQACGDAFGAPFEYHPDAPALAELSLQEGRYLDSDEDVRKEEIRFCRLPGLYTDDTQQALCLVKARLQTSSKEEAAEMFMADCRTMAAEKIQGSTFGVHRGTGGLFRSAVKSGKPPDSAGIGSCMRIGPVATLFENGSELAEWVLAVSRTTTSNDLGLACAVRFALAAYTFPRVFLGQGGRYKTKVTCPEGISAEAWSATHDALRVMREEGEEALVVLAQNSGWANKPLNGPASGFGLTGYAWVVYEVVSASSFEDALYRVCRLGGDTDTVGAMAGCLAALKFGEEGIPAWMKDGLHGKDHLTNPETWDPIESETPLTEADVQCRQEIVQRRKERRSPILFYGRSKPYPEFSNFYRRSIVLDGETWASTEHYFQTAKATKREHWLKIKNAKSPAEAAKLGRKISPIVPDWDYIKYHVMYKAVLAKFSQHEDLRELLLSTGSRPLHEDCPDEWWGGGPKHPNGRDWLGKILMSVRDGLRSPDGNP